MANVGVDVFTSTDVTVDEFIRACSYEEKEELRDEIMQYFDIEPINRDADVSDVVADLLLTRPEENTVEAREYIREVMNALAEKVRNRNFVPDPILL